jgi:hypothetical protein
MRNLIRKILHEETKKDLTKYMQRLLDNTIVFNYPDDICKIEVEGNIKNDQYPRYWVSVIFKVSDNHLTDRDLAKNIMGDIWTTINSYFEILPSMRSAFVRNCEEDTTDLFEGELTERCWKGYTQKGMKTMFGKRYPNCVKKKK